MGVHVLPLDDLKPHVESERCDCKPSIQEGVIVHNSYDGREFFEPENDDDPEWQPRVIVP